MHYAIERAFPAITWTALLLTLTTVRPASAQDEGYLREDLEGTVVATKIEMPGSADGVTIAPDAHPALDFARLQSSLRKFGVALAIGQRATITKIRVKKSLIEVQFDGGGFGTAEQVLNGEVDGSPEEARKRAEGGARFNIRFEGAVPSNYLYPDSLRIALAKYVDFDPPPAPVITQTVPAAEAPSASAGGVDTPQPNPAATSVGSGTGLVWAPQVGWSNELFPSFIIATADIHVPSGTDPQVLGDPRGVVGVRVTAPAAGARIKLIVSSPGLMEESEAEVALPKAGENYLILPTIAWDFDALTHIRQARPATVMLSIMIDGEEVGKTTERVTVRSINDAPYFFEATNADGKLEGHATPWMFAAYVNENSPENDELRREALQSGVIASFDGYQGGSDEAVIRQVYAMWNVLQRRGVKYSNITTTARESDVVASQQVRFPAQSVNNAQANCVDGSVLFASVMREVGIDPVLVSVPGHMFVGFYLDKAHTRIFYLETTMLGQADLRPEADPWGLGRLFGGNQSWTTFTQAWTSATERYTREESQFRRGNPRYQTIDIGAVRQLGILPIAYSQ
jgi:hypothetical protein